MQGGEAEPQHNNRLEGIDKPTLPTLAGENKIDMQEGAQEQGGGNQRV